jgi:biopolymer transport protein ExbD
LRRCLYKLIALLSLLAAPFLQSACSSLPAAASTQDRVLTNRLCKDHVVVKLIPKDKDWYVEVGKSRYRLSKAGAVLKPIMESRPNKSVYLIVPEKVRYTVLQEFADYAREAGVTCVNWGNIDQKPPKGVFYPAP